MTNKNPSKKSILIVDDEPNVRQSLADYFEDRRWEVLTAESGETAFELLSKQCCEAAIVDIRMGQMDGESFIRKAHKKCPEMVFCICTGSPEFQISEDLMQNPNVLKDVFAKPIIKMQDLSLKILELLEKNSS